MNSSLLAGLLISVLAPHVPTMLILISDANLFLVHFDMSTHTATVNQHT